MDQAEFHTEMMKDTMIQVQAMRAAGETMKAQFKEFNLDDVEDLQDDLEDLYMDMAEVQEVMSRSYSMADDIDETELEQG